MDTPLPKEKNKEMIQPLEQRGLSQTVASSERLTLAAQYLVSASCRARWKNTASIWTVWI